MNIILIEFSETVQLKCKMTGKVYIASMKMRGKWAERPENTKIINVTSAQGKNNLFRRDFSPMTGKEYKGFY